MPTGGNIFYWTFFCFHVVNIDIIVILVHFEKTLLEPQQPINGRVILRICGSYTMIRQHY